MFVHTCICCIYEHKKSVYLVCQLVKINLISLHYIVCKHCNKTRAFFCLKNVLNCTESCRLKVNK